MFAIALGIFVGVYNAYNADKAGRDQKRLSDEQARVAQENADREANRLLQDHTQTAGEQAAQIYASGSTMEGSPYLLMMRDAEWAKEDAAAIRRSGATQAQFLSASGRAAQRAGRNQAIGTLLATGADAAGKAGERNRVDGAQGTGVA